MLFLKLTYCSPQLKTQHLSLSLSNHTNYSIYIYCTVIESLSYCCCIVLHAPPMADVVVVVVVVITHMKHELTKSHSNLESKSI